VTGPEALPGLLLGCTRTNVVEDPPGQLEQGTDEVLYDDND